VNETSLFGENFDYDKTFTTEKETPFLSFGPSTQSKQTGIFIDRFFNRVKFK